ncbi:hypothetical protein EDB84DRAFT_1443805 [Lactarius hengduanensis]|nr:hypothetical protein EDB84DRAFT_1443805 [Lactarius hengduanensis]
MVAARGDVWCLSALPLLTLTVHSYRTGDGLKKHPGVPHLPNLKFHREEKRLLRFVHADPFRPVPTTGTYDDGTELTLSSLACLVAMHGVSPAGPEMPSIGSGKTKVQEGKAKGKRFCSCSTRSAWCRKEKECPPWDSTRAPRCLPKTRSSSDDDTAHTLRATRRRA